MTTRDLAAHIAKMTKRAMLSGLHPDAFPVGWLANAEQQECDGIADLRERAKTSRLARGLLAALLRGDAAGQDCVTWAHGWQLSDSGAPPAVSPVSSGATGGGVL